jgi:D-glycero-alpha-D-manno-heptose-7-phosphate kinase
MRYNVRAPLRIDFAGGWTDVPLYAEREGGAVLSAAITRYVRGYIARPEGDGVLRAIRSDRSYVSYSLDAPPGSGLGASAAQTVVWVTLVKSSVANVSDRREIAEMAWQVSNVLGLTGGKQDEYASALGGIALYKFGQSVEVDRLDADTALMNALRDRLVLVYSGIPRISSHVHEGVWSRYRAGDKSVAAALSTLKRLAVDMRESLRAGDLDSFALQMRENWTQQQALDPGVRTAALDGIMEIAEKNGAVGWKACGAGGGGCVLLMVRAGEAPRLQAALRRERLRVIDFDFDTYGVFLTKG